MAKREALQQFHKDNISSVADKLFQQYGYEKTTMDDIAKEADYSKATLYVYFKSKEDIFNYIVLKAMSMLLQSMQVAVNANQHILQQYKEICRQWLAFEEEHPFYFQSLLKTIRADEDSRKSDPVLDEIYQIGEQVNSLMEGVIENGVQQGVLRPGTNGVPLGLMYMAAISSIIQLAGNKEAYIENRTGMNKQQFLSFCFRTLVEGVLLPGAAYNEYS